MCVCVGWLRTFLAVGLSILEVEGIVANRLLAGGAQETIHMPGLLQGIDHFLKKEEEEKKSAMDSFLFLFFCNEEVHVLYLTCFHSQEIIFHRK